MNSPYQERFWALEALSAPGAYTISAGFWLEGPLDEAGLRAALKQLVERHNALGGALNYDVLDVTDLMEQLPALLSKPLDAPFRARLFRLRRDRALLVLNAHHAAVDGLALARLLEELGALYGGEALSAPAAMPAPTFEEAHVNWFKRHLQGAERYELSPDHALGARPPGRVLLALSSRCLEPFWALCDSCGATRFMGLHCLVSMVLARRTQRFDVIVGGVVKNRSADQTPAIDCRVNTLPMILDLSGAPSFREALKRCRDFDAQALTRQNAPLNRQMSALISCLLVLQPQAPLSLKGLRVRRAVMPPVAPKMDLVFEFRGAKDSLQLTLEYDRARLSRATALALARDLERLIVRAPQTPDSSFSIVRTPSVLLGSALTPVPLPALDSPSFEQLLPGREDGGEQPKDVVLESTRSVLERVFAQPPERAAVIEPEREVSYGALRTRACALGAQLQAEGVRPGDRVALLLPPGAAAVAAMLAVWMLGAAYVPLEPENPDAYLKDILEQCAPAAVVTEEHERACVLGQVIIRPSRSEGALKPSPSKLSMDAVAYIVFTSGTTGTPKGVRVTQGNLAYLLDATSGFGFGPQDRWAWCHSIAFDFSVWEIWGALGSGGQLVALPSQTRKLPASLARALTRHRVTVLNQTPTAFEGLSALSQRFEDLRWVIFGGEALRPRALRRWFETHRGGAQPRLVNMYGITEVTVHASWGEIVEEQDCEASPIGEPLPGTTIALLDENGRAVPSGAPGEIWVKGPGVSAGYLNEPEHERFSEPAGRPGRWYRSGDLARVHPELGLVFLGRKDRQVKIRGHRIEPAATELALGKTPGVQSALVEAIDGALIAFVVGETEQRALRAACSALPAAARPSRYLQVRALPLTLSGKRDVRALRRIAQSALPAASAPEYGGTLQVLGEALGCAIGAEDDFFEMGGHSLMVLDVARVLSEALGVDVPARWLFETPQAGAFAQRIAELERADDRAPTIPKTSDEARPWATPAQAGLWFLERTSPAPLYNVVLALQFEEPAESSGRRLSAALTALVVQQESLRCRLVLDGERPRIVVSPAQPVVLEVLSDVAVQEEVERAYAHRFELEDAPPWYARLIADGAERSVLVLCLHHCACDEESLQVIAKSLSGPALPPAITFRDYAAWRSQRDESPAVEAVAQRLRGAARVPLEALGMGSSEGAGANRVQLALPELTEASSRVARSAATTPFVVFLAAVAALLRRYTGQETLLIGVPINVRPSAAAGLVGMFTSTFVVRLEVGDNPSFVQLIERARAAMRFAQQHRDAPFEEVVRALNPPRDSAWTPLVSVMVSQERTLTVPGARLYPAVSPAAKVELQLTLRGAEILAQSASAVFSEHALQALVEHLARLWRSGLDSRALRVSALSMLSAEERALCLPERPPPLQVRSLLASWRARVLQAPEAVAVRGEEEVHRAALDERARRFAGHLSAKGVGAGDVVALWSERGVPWLVGVLAAQYLQAILLPLDPHAPQQRVMQQLRIAKAIHVVCPASLFEGLGDRSRDGLNRSWPGEEPVDAPLQEAPAEALEAPGFLLFTSGSTAAPKGVLLSRMGIAHRMAWDLLLHPLQPQERVSWMASPSFDASLHEVFKGLLGGELVVVPSGLELDPQELGTFLQAYEVAVALFVPTMLERFVQAGQLQRVRSLRAIYSGGEALPSHLAQGILRAREGLALYNLYGPTECSIDATAFQVPRDFRAASVPLGYAIGDTRVYVLGPDRELLPPGVPGELYISGAGVALGYIQDAEETARRFVPDPYEAPAERSAHRMYRTGDRCVLRAPQGYFEYLGRLDEEIKIRGVRIQPQQIEAILLEQPGVQAARVVPFGSERRPEGLDGFVVGTASAERLMSSLQARLPRAMLPRSITLLESLPVGERGKLDRSALVPQLATEAAPRASQDARVQALKEIWAEVLGRPVPVDRSFFELGGHSLLLVEVKTLIEARFSRAVGMVELLRHATIEALAEHLAQRGVTQARMGGALEDAKRRGRARRSKL